MPNPAYKCPRCGYETRHKPSMYSHLYKKKKQCCSNISNIELTDEIKKHILDNRTYNVVLPVSADSLVDEVAKLKLQVAILKKQYKEDFFQKIVEKYLGGTHKKLAVGETDVTNDDTHAEIKKFEDYKEAIGKLMCYNNCDPKDNLHAYLFGATSSTLKKMKSSSHTTLRFNTEIFALQGS